MTGAHGPYYLDGSAIFGHVGHYCPLFDDLLAIGIRSLGHRPPCPVPTLTSPMPAQKKLQRV
jgi:hypothetical protein